MARTLSYQVGILTLGRLFAYAVMFFVPVVNVRMLSVDDLGLYRQYWLIYDTVAIILVMGFPNSLLYYFPRAETPRVKAVYLTQTLAYLFVVGVASWGIYAVLRAVLGGGLGGVIREFFWPLSFFTLFMLVSKTMERLFVADRQAEKQSLYHAVSWSIQALTVITVSLLTGRVDLIIRALLLFAFLKMVFALIYSRAVYDTSVRDISIRSAREQMSYALPLGLASTALVLFAQTDKYVIVHYLGREAFAIYSIGALQLPFIDIVRNSIYNIAFPMMARYQKDGKLADILDLWQRVTLKTAVLFFPIFVFLEATATPFITVLFTGEFAGAAPVFMIYLLIFLRMTLETGSVLMVFKRTALLLRINVAAFVVNVGLSIVMFKTFGRLGVPFATVIVMYLQNAINLLIASRLLGVSPLRVMPWAKLGVRLLTALVPGLVLYGMQARYPIRGLAGLGLAAAGYFVVYFALCFRFRLIGKSDIRSILGRGGE